MNWTLITILLVWLVGAVGNWFWLKKNSDEGVFGRLVMSASSWALLALAGVTWIAKRF